MNNLSKFTNYGKIVLAVIGVIVCALLFNGPNTNVNTTAEIAKFRDGGQMSFATLFTLFILVACVALILIFFVTQLISNPKKTIMSIIGIAVGLVIYLIFYAIGTKDTDVSLGLVNSVGSISKGTITATTAGLWTVIIGLALALLAILGSGLMRFIKR